MWEILVSRNFAIRDEPNVQLRCSRNVKRHLFYRWKHEAGDDPPPPTLSPSPFTVYTTKTSPCMPVPRAHVENTCARGAGIHRGFQRVTHHTPHTPHTPQPTTTITPHGDRHRERQKQGEKRKRKGRRQRRQDNRREQRDDSFLVWWCMAVFCWCCDLSR